MFCPRISFALELVTWTDCNYFTVIPAATLTEMDDQESNLIKSDQLLIDHPVRTLLFFAENSISITYSCVVTLSGILIKAYTLSTVAEADERASNWKWTILP